MLVRVQRAMVPLAGCINGERLQFTFLFSPEGIGMTNFEELNQKMTSVMGELIELLLPHVSPEARAQYEEPEYECRGCEGHGTVSFTVRPNDPRDEYEVEDFTCPECFGDKTVDQAKHDEQYEYDEESFRDMVSQDAFEMWRDIESDGYL